MEASLCREHLERLLREETATLTRLETLLEHEHTVIASQDIEELDRTGAQRQEYIGALVRIDDERRSLCRLHGKTADLSGLEQLINWCDPQRTLQTRLEECAQRATHCRAHNDRNGMLVATRLKRVKGLLNVITGRSTQPVAYGRLGAYSAETTGRMISSEA